MKIAFFLDISYGLGGAGNLLLQQAVLMSKIHEVTVVIPSDKTGNYNLEYEKRCRRYQIPYVCIQYNTAYSFSMIDFVAAMESAEDIEEFAKTKQIDFFHSVQLNTAVEFVSRKLSIPHLMSVYQLRKEEFKIQLGDIYAHFHLCDSLIYSNRWSQQLHIESKCIRPVALLDQIKKKNYIIQKKIKILMLGNVCMRKNQMAAIKAIEMCEDFYEVELHIAGNIDNCYGNKCKEYVKQHFLEEKIIFHGFVSQVEELLEDSDCLLCSSIDESFPSSIVEALTYDLTIISTPVAGVPELLFDKKNSFISKDFSYQNISKSISECIEYYKTKKIKDIHSYAEKTWRENFERNIVRRELDSYYQSIIKTNVSDNLDPFYKIFNIVKPLTVLLTSINNMGEKWVCGRALYYAFVNKHLNNKKIYIWGAGKRGGVSFEILKKLCPDSQIVAFIDSYKRGTYYNYPVLRVDEVPINKEYFYCISFFDESDKAIQYLEDKGLQLNQQIWMMP